MPTPRTAKPKTRRTPKPTPRVAGSKEQDVDGFLRDLDHPLKPELETLRRLIRSVSPSIGEGLKWNAPSFHMADHFATFMLRDRDRLQLILHTGAKAKNVVMIGVKDVDPDGLLEWLGKERARVVFTDAADVKAKSAGLKRILKAWIARL